MSYLTQLISLEFDISITAVTLSLHKNHTTQHWSHGLELHTAVLEIWAQSKVPNPELSNREWLLTDVTLRWPCDGLKPTKLHNASMCGWRARKQRVVMLKRCWNEKYVGWEQCIICRPAALAVMSELEWFRFRTYLVTLPFWNRALSYISSKPHTWCAKIHLGCTEDALHSLRALSIGSIVPDSLWDANSQH